MAIAKQPAPARKSLSPALVKLGAFIGVVCLLLQLVVLKIHHASSVQSPVFQPPIEPILLLGLPRSGSLALHQYFTCHGKKSVHYCCGESGRTKFPCGQSKTCGSCVLRKLKAQKPFGECQSAAQVWSQFDVETADAWFLPQHFALGLLHQTYPNATWILNRRGDSRQWAKSVLHWNSMTRRIFNSYGLDLYPHAIQEPPNPSSKITAAQIEADMARSLNEWVYNRTEYFRKLTLLDRIYQNHTATIRAWAQQFPSHQLIEVVAEDETTPAVLDQAFGYVSEGKCEWSFDSSDHDWKDFSLPF